MELATILVLYACVTKMCEISREITLATRVSDSCHCISVLAHRECYMYPKTEGNRYGKLVSYTAGAVQLLHSRQVAKVVAVLPKIQDSVRPSSLGRRGNAS